MVKSRDLLLYVDDEEQALKYFRLTFAKDYEVLTATSADEAWKLIDQHADHLALVISDQRMPGRSGVELLTSVKERCPRAIRLLTTAYSELSSAIAAVNEGEIYAYVTKPWKLDELKVLIRQALNLYHLRCERDALLAEKLGVVQRLLLADRNRVLGMALAGLTGQVRRPLAAAAAWLLDRQRAFALPSAEEGDARDLWPAVLRQSRDCAVIAGDLGQWLAGIRGLETPTDVAQILTEGAATAGATTILERTPTIMPVDHAFLAAGFTELVRLLRDQLRSPEHSAMVRVRDSDNHTILTLRLDGHADATVLPDRAGLAAYLAIHHHGGSITIPAWSTSGGEVDIVFGGSTDEGLADFLSQLADAED